MNDPFGITLTEAGAAKWADYHRSLDELLPYGFRQKYPYGYHQESEDGNHRFVRGLPVAGSRVVEQLHEIIRILGCGPLGSPIYYETTMRHYPIERQDIYRVPVPERLTL